METLILLAIGLLALIILAAHVRKIIRLSQNDGKGDACASCGKCSSSCKEWTVSIENINPEQHPPGQKKS